MTDLPPVQADDLTSGSGVPPPTSTGDVTDERNGPRRWQVVLVLVGVALPVLRMANLVRQATATQYSDYWPMFPTVFTYDGGLSLRGIFQFRNVHSLVTAKILYWINFQISGGSNNVLGYIVVAFVVAQLVLVFLLLRRSADLTWWARGGVVVTAAVLLFARHGTWNFVHAMSGAAWLTANFFALAALVVEGRSRQRRFGAVLLGLAASLSYGTGLMVWPALMLTATVRDRKVWRHWLIVVGGVASVLWYQFQPLAWGPAVHGGGRDIDLVKFLAVVGASVARGSVPVAVTVGVVVLVVGAAAGTVMVRRAPERVAPWLGVWAYGLCAASFIAFGRTVAVERLVGIGRYSSLGALAILAATVLVLHVIPLTGRRSLAVAGVWLVLVTAVWQGDAGVAAYQIESGYTWDELAVVQRLHLADGTKRWLLVEEFPPITGQMEHMGHYPFNGDFRFGCDLLGRPFGADPVSQVLPDGALGHRGPGKESPGVPGMWSARGWFSEPLDCAVATDARGDVVGVGVVRTATNPKYVEVSTDSVQFAVLARVDESPEHVLVRVSDTGQWVELHVPEWYQANR